MSRTADLVIRRPRRVIVASAIIAAGCAVLGSGVSKHLHSGGFDNPAAASQRGAATLQTTFGVREVSTVFAVTANGGTVDSPAVAAAGRALTGELTSEPGVALLSSYWTSTGQAASAQRSTDGRTGLVSVALDGDDERQADRSRELARKYDVVTPAFTIRAGGPAQGDADSTDRVTTDLATAEGIAIPLTALLLILVFGSLVAGLLPLIVGGSAIVGTLASLFLLSEVTDVSVYALNLTTAMGIGLGLDYALLVVSRYREELSAGAAREAAIRRTMTTAGRTIAFSAATVGVSLAALLVFPLYFLRSFAYAAMAVVLISAVSALVLLPAVLVALGPRVDLLSLPWRRGGRGASAESPFWARLARVVMRRPLLTGLPVVALLLFAGAPFLHVQVGRPDDRVLQRGESSRQVGDLLRGDFPVESTAAIQAVLPSLGSHAAALPAYAAMLSTLPSVGRVVAPSASYAHGVIDGPGLASQARAGAAYLVVLPTVDPNSDAARTLVKEIRKLPAPSEVLVAGQPAELLDSVDAVTDNLPLAIGLIALATFVLLFLFTGSVVLPLKALALNVISLSAVMGILVWVFQEGHLSGLLGFTPTPLAVAMPLLMFCVAFGLSMDYEVFLLGRIAELHHAGADTVTSVSVGLARTGRIVTTAAAVLSITFFSFISSGVSFIQLFGLGTGIAIVIDSTLVRGVLVPAAMRLMGAGNWWAPAPLRRLHDRFGLAEHDHAPTEPERELAYS